MLKCIRTIATEVFFTRVIPLWSPPVPGGLPALKVTRMIPPNPRCAVQPPSYQSDPQWSPQSPRWTCPPSKLPGWSPSDPTLSQVGCSPSKLPEWSPSDPPMIHVWCRRRYNIYIYIYIYIYRRVVLRMHMPPPIFSEIQRRHRMPPSSTLVAMALGPPRFRQHGARQKHPNVQYPLRHI